MDNFFRKFMSAWLALGSGYFSGRAFNNSFLGTAVSMALLAVIMATFRPDNSDNKSSGN